MRCVLLVVPVMLAACGQPSRDTTPARPVLAADGYAAKVAALPDKQRLGVMLRAIRDAGQNCQRVVEATAASGMTASGTVPPAWVATCDDRHQWVVAIADDGTATVADAKDLARRG